MNVTFDFSIGQSVKVKPIGMIGTIDSLILDNNGPQYRVVYWNDGIRQSVWMYAWEIEAANRCEVPERGAAKEG